MLVCKVCGKKFKGKDALAGHMASAHPQKKPDQENNTPEPTETERVIEAVSEEPSQPMDEEPGKMESIRKLRRQGYSARQVKEGFGYARSTAQ